MLEFKMTNALFLCEMLGFLTVAYSLLSNEIKMHSLPIQECIRPTIEVYKRDDIWPLSYSNVNMLAL